MNKDKQKRNGIIVLLFLTLVIIVGLYLSQIPQNIIKRVQLVYFFSRFTTYNKNKDWKSLYNLFSSDNKARISLDEYVKNGQTIYSSDPQINSYYLDGKNGVIADMTSLICYSSTCKGSDRYETRRYKLFLY